MLNFFNIQVIFFLYFPYFSVMLLQVNKTMQTLKRYNVFPTPYFLFYNIFLLNTRIQVLTVYFSTNTKIYEIFKKKKKIALKAVNK